MKTQQEIFDIVSTHLLKQNRQSRLGCDDESRTSGVCVYRSPAGLQCAVGCLIDAAHYTEVMEQAGSLVNFDSRLIEDYDKEKWSSPRCVGARDVLVALKAADIDLAAPGVFSLLSRLQSLHDNEESKRWRCSLQLVAEAFNLKFNHAEH